VFGTSLSATQLNAASTTEGTFTYLPAIGTKLNAGINQSLSVTFTPTDAANFNSVTRQVTITVNKATPVITWNNPNEIVYGTSLSATQLNATSTTDGTFTYSPAIGTKLNAGSNQSVSVTFTPTDATNYTTATKQVNIAVAKATPAVTWNTPAEIVYGTSLSATQLNATSATDGTFVYSPASGTKLNAGSNQSLSVTFTPVDAANYNSATKQVAIAVSKSTPNITWSNPTEIVFGTSLSATQLNATSTTEGTFTYSPTSGTKLNAGSSQSLSVTFTPTDAANYTTATKQLNIAVAKATPAVTWNNPNEIVYGTSLSSTQLNATSTTDGTFTYSPAIGTKLNAGSNQSLSVTFTPTDAANYTTASKQVTISVAKASQQLTFLQLPDKLFGSGVIELTATATSGLPVKFSFSSDKISINETQVTLLKAGRVKILALQSGNDNFLAAVSSEQSFCIKPIKPIIEAPILSGSGFILTSNSATGNQWFLNDKLLPSATGQTLNATESGTYKLQVNADDCASEFSLEKALVVTGDLQDDLSKIEIYPNPVIDWLTIKLGEESIKKEVSIVDLTGRQMVQKEVYGSEAQVNVADYSQGIYLLKVSSSTTTRIIKFEKQQ
jgi:phage-related protein